MSQRHDVAFHIGERWTLPFTVNDANGAAVSLSGLTGSAIEWRLASPDALIMKRIIGDGINIEPDQTANKGKGTVVVTEAMQAGVAALVPGKYDHQLDVTFADGSVSTQVVGKFNAAKSLKKQFP